MYRYFGAVILVMALLVAGCGVPASYSQGNGLPPLTHVDWGFNSIFNPIWSPNGQWIVALVGNDYAGSHWEVLSLDNRFHQDLHSWNCGVDGEVSMAWLPDSLLSCFARRTLVTGAYPFNYPQATTLSIEITPFTYGGVWAADASQLLAVTSNDPQHPVMGLDQFALVALNAQGMVDPRRGGLLRRP